MPKMRPLIHERNMIAANWEVRQGGRNTRTISTWINVETLWLFYVHVDFNLVCLCYANHLLTSHFLDLSDITPNMFYINSFHFPNTLVVISVLVTEATGGSCIFHWELNRSSPANDGQWFNHPVIANQSPPFIVVVVVVVVVVVIKFFNKNFVRRKVENIGIQYRHTKINNNVNIVESCPCEINISLLIYITIEKHAGHEVFAHDGITESS